MQSLPQHPRLNAYHPHKQRILGNQAAHPAPAWRPNVRAASGSHNKEIGSKILLSRLPVDVVEEEVEILFSRTVGPVKEVFMVYNSQAKSRGMAVVSFTRPGDAALARAKYNGKIVDGRRPIKIEVVIDEDDTPSTAPASQTAPGSLLSRISLPTSAFTPTGPAPPNKTAQANSATAPAANSRVRLRNKKGPRRLNKQRAQQQSPAKAKEKPKPKTVKELDQEMDDYRAGANGR